MFYRHANLLSSPHVTDVTLREGMRRCALSPRRHQPLGGWVVEKRYRAIFHSPDPSSRMRMNNSRHWSVPNLQRLGQPRSVQHYRPHRRHGCPISEVMAPSVVPTRVNQRGATVAGREYIYAGELLDPAALHLTGTLVDYSIEQRSEQRELVILRVPGGGL